MDIAAWERAVEYALADCGLSYRPDYHAIALLIPRPPEAKLLAADMRIAMERLFWNAVCARKIFGDIARVEQHFGRSLENNYGTNDGPFLDVARAYWTYRLEMRDILPQYFDAWIAQALIAVEFNIAKLFFPMPGPLKLPKKLRKHVQKEYLNEWAPHFDIERFLKENPMLKGWFG